MKKSIIITLALSLTLLVAVQAMAQSGEIVVDRSTRNKALNDYTLLTRDAIQRAWTTPVTINQPGALKGRVSIAYSIARDGSVLSVELVSGSGNPDMDRSLVTAIRSAAPFPAFPDEVQAPSILIRANFVVADLPTVPVVVARHDTAEAPKLVETEPEKTPKKYIWGVPAGSSESKTSDSENLPDSPSPTKKYHWGLDQ